MQQRQQEMAERRQQVGRLIYSLWTQDGSDEAGCAPALFDGRVDALSWYVMGEESNFTTAGVETIDRVHCKDLSYVDFCEKYMFPNRPVIIEGLTANWKSRQLWVRPDGRPNMAYIGETFGSDIVPVHEQLSPGFSATRPVSSEMSVAEYVAWCDEHPENESSPLLYLKDWKFVAVHPDYDAYEWPKFFRDDWLNEATGNAYKFVYLGTKGSSTVLHADVLRSFSWSTNICGRKRWYLIPPECTILLYDCFGKQLASHLHVDLQHGLDTFFPGLSRARQSAIEIVQEADETIFVPSNWFHTVENLQDTLSINHNWLNGANIRHCWRHVESEMRSLRQGKHEFAFPVDSRIYLTATITDYSQLEEDVLLLWHVVSKKAKSIIDSAHKEGITVRIRSDLDGILFILQGLLALVHNGSKSVLTSRSDCNVAELQSVVAGFLTTPEKDSID